MFITIGKKWKMFVAEEGQETDQGTLTDGDARRALRNANLNTKITEYIKKNPYSIKIKTFNYR